MRLSSSDPSEADAAEIISWAYEREYRVFVELKDCDPSSFLVGTLLLVGQRNCIHSIEDLPNLTGAKFEDGVKL